MCQHMESPSYSTKCHGSQHPGSPRTQHRLSFYDTYGDTYVSLSTSCLSQSTNLLWGVRVDELAVDTTSLGLLQSWRGNPVVLTGQPELQVLLTKLWTQEPTERLQSSWKRSKQDETLLYVINTDVDHRRIVLYVLMLWSSSLKW